MYLARSLKLFQSAKKLRDQLTLLQPLLKVREMRRIQELISSVFSAGLEKDFNGGNKKFQANFTMTYYFERYHGPK